MTKPLAKSLHTITVLVRTAQMIRPLHPHATNEGLIGLVSIGLGYVDAADPYGLKEAALRQLNKATGQAD